MVIMNSFENQVEINDTIVQRFKVRKLDVGVA